MALNIKDTETERLAGELAALTHETKTGAIRTALNERKARLLAMGPKPRTVADMMRFLEEEIWPQIPKEIMDSPSLEKSQREKILGYGPEGV